MIYDAAVIGGALSGSRTAELLAKQGHKVLLIEEHSNIGEPCKCTGLVSWRTPEMLKLPKEIIVNLIDKANFHAPNGTFFTLKCKKQVYVLDRPGLDRFLFNSAVEAGADAKTSETFERFWYNNGTVRVKTNKGVYDAKVLIGADGGNSQVAKQANLEMPKNFFSGLQTTAEGDFENVELWFGSKLCPKFFCWIVPENKHVARVGIAAEKNPNFYYQNFLRKRVKTVANPNVAGIIRFGVMKDTVSDRILLVGDAACQMKPVSGGGITYGLIGAQFAADACHKALEENKFSYRFFKEEYDERWKERLVPGIKKGMFYRKLLFSMSDSQINVAFRMIKTLGYRLLEKLDFDLLLS
ncbi:MAG: NAD(P)/FAD-dependent oxidoreductase [Candidatus Aenigmarchaeota archaeon]|nr:NAD(P)/FAD-dependent oxidoreductase [Candidatus Aenigmarchaeota archaeon]